MNCHTHTCSFFGITVNSANEVPPAQPPNSQSGGFQGPYHQSASQNNPSQEGSNFQSNAYPTQQSYGNEGQGGWGSSS